MCHDMDVFLIVVLVAVLVRFVLDTGAMLDFLSRILALIEMTHVESVIASLHSHD